MSERSFEDLMESAIGLDFSIGDIFRLSMEEAEQNLDEYSQKFNVKTQRVKNALLDPVRSEIRKEMNKLLIEVAPELYRKIDLLLQASFIAGQDTDAFFHSNIIGSLKSKGKKAALVPVIDWLEKKKNESAYCRRGGKAPKYNPVLLEAIRQIWHKYPEKSAAAVIRLLKDKVDDLDFQVDGYDILIQEPGSLYNGEVLEYSSFVCFPVDPKNAKHGCKLRAITPDTLKRYCTRIKKEES